MLGTSKQVPAGDSVPIMPVKQIKEAVIMQLFMCMHKQFLQGWPERAAKQAHDLSVTESSSGPNGTGQLPVAGKEDTYLSMYSAFFLYLFIL